MASFTPLVLAALFTVAGAASLVHEVTWLEVLSRSLSGSGRVLAPVLAGFLSGLALGAYFQGRWSRSPSLRSTNDWLRCYAVLEAAAALLAAAMPWWLRTVAESTFPFLSPAGASSLRLAVCTVSILVATLPLGATFPIQVLLLRQGWLSTERCAGMVLALQTAGGACGVMLTGFIALPRLGVSTTQWIAAGAGLAVAAGAALLSTRRELEPLHETRRETTVTTAQSSTSKSSSSAVGERARRATLLTIAAGVGFASLCFEVVQTRVLAFFLPDLACSFSAMLATYLVSLSLGAGAAAWFGDRWFRGRMLPGLIAGGAALAVVSAMRQIDGLYARVHEVEATTGGFSGVLPFLWATAVASFRLLGPGAFLMGMVLPICVGRLATSSGDARAAARAYAFNSLGSALGALMAGLFFVGWFGLRGSLVAIAALLAACALLSVITQWSTQRGGLASSAAILVLLAVAGGLAVASEPSRPVVLDSKVFQSRRANTNSRSLLAVDEGDVASVAVVEDTTGRFLITDAFQAAGTGDTYLYMRMLGHLPALLRPQSERVLVIAFGTGTTAGALTLHDSIHAMSLVDLCAKVYDFAPWFASVNHGVLQTQFAGLALQPIVDDGRAALRRTTERFDIVTLEPLLPSSPAAVHFYTREFFALVHGRLAPGGVLCHWIPIHAQPLEHLQCILRAYADEFEEGEVYAFGSALVLLGWNGRPKLDCAELEAGIAAASIAPDLAEVEVRSARDLFTAYYCTTSTLREHLESVVPATDDRPRISYPRLRPNHESFHDEVESFRWLMSIEDDGPPLLDEADPELHARSRIARKVRREFQDRRLDALEEQYLFLDAEWRKERGR